MYIHHKQNQESLHPASENRSLSMTATTQALSSKKPASANKFTSPAINSNYFNLYTRASNRQSPVSKQAYNL
jgi:hypothetical protein